MKKRYLHFLILGGILIFALIIRLSGLTKTSGLWYDEMALYSIASKSFFSGMLIEDAHRFLLFPIYFLTYKCWLSLFGNSDFIIRLMSVFFDMASLICAYFVGISFASLINKNEQKYIVGLFNALLYSINSSFIYYAQEAKFYSLTFFLINLLIIFWIKFLQNPNKTNKFLFLISNGLLLYTYTSQILLIIILQLATLFYFYKKNEIKKYTSQFLGFLIVLIPLFIMIFSNKNYFSGNFDAVVYDNSFILLVVQNWFSPILAGLQNNILSYQYFVLMNILSIKWWIFIFFPIIFYFTLLVKGSRKEYVAKLFLAVAFLYLITQITLTQFANYSVLVRYVLPALPFVLIVAANGLQKIYTKKKGRIFLGIFLLVNLIALMSPIGATKIQRPGNYKDLANILISNKITPEQSFILPIRVSLLDKYYNITGEKYSIYSLNGEKYQKTYLTDSEMKEINQKKNLYKNYKRFLLSENIFKDFENLIKEDYIKNIPPKNELILITDKTICMYSDKMLKQIVSNQDLYEKNPIQFLRLSKLNNDLIKVLSKNMTIKKDINLGSWQVYVFKKTG